MNRRGWITIVEAVVAIMIVFASILVVINKNKTEQSTETCSFISQYLSEISKNESLRYAVISGNSSMINNYLSSTLNNPAYNYQSLICTPDDPCLPPNSISEKVELCAGERLITSAKNAPNADAKKVKIFLYKKI